MDSPGDSHLPLTRDHITAALSAAGVTLGATVMVHSSLSQLGHVAGGAQAVVLALQDVVGDSGTLVMPTHSGHLSDPAGWRHPAVPQAWWERLRQATPAYDSQLTPTRGMGAVVECFRHLPEVRRSQHPLLSFAAVGGCREQVVEAHALTPALGESSPLARLYDLDAWVLLLAVGHANNTSLHLAEHRANYPGKRWVTCGAPMTVSGERRWLEWSDLDPDASDFPAVGEAFAAVHDEVCIPLGAGTARLMRQRQLVDYATDWFTENRR